MVPDRFRSVRSIWIVAFAIAGFALKAEAQTWNATVHLAYQQPGPITSCPNVSAVFRFTISDDELVAKTPSGATHRSRIAADGIVNMTYDSTHRSVGFVTIAGNTRLRKLTAISSTFSGCIYSLVEAAPPDPLSAQPGN